MRAVDTNILARLVLADDPAQFDAAFALLDHPIWVAPTIWLELGWVLGKHLARTEVADALSSLLALEPVHVPDTDGLRWAIDRYRSGADWADMIHLVSARDVADRFATFDRGIARHAGDDAPVAVEMLA